MITPPSLFTLATPLFFSNPNIQDPALEKTDCKASIDALAEEAKSGNEDAIELLINFSSGASHQDIRQLAERSLIDLYSNPKVSDYTKLQIEVQALAFHEATEKANEKGGSMSLAPHEISTQILYLAGQRAHSLGGYKAIEDKINEHLHGQIYKHDNGEHDKNLLDRGRFVSADELMICSPQFSYLKPHTNCLNINNETSFTKAIGEMTAGQDQTGPATAFVNTGDHWVPLILQRSANGAVNCYVFDSNFKEESPILNDIQEKLTKALSTEMGEFHFLSIPMQENTPNACGPLAMRLLSDLNSHPKVHSPDFDIEAAIEESVSNWLDLGDNQKNAMVTAIRAQLLGAMVRPVNANE